MKVKKSKTFIILGLIVVIAIVGLFSIPFIKFIEDPEKLRNFIDSFGVFSYLAYILLVTIQIMIPFIPGEPFEMFAGYAFGGLKGGILCFIAESIGSIIVVLLVRKYGRKIVETFLLKNKYENYHF